MRVDQVPLGRLSLAFTFLSIKIAIHHGIVGLTV